jgi:acyl-CoA synthetase (AMP-forming)/AMP-acid ligase II
MFYDSIGHWQFRYYLFKTNWEFFHSVFLTCAAIVIANTKFCFFCTIVCCDINHARVRAGQSISHTEKTTASQDVEEASKSEDDEWEDLSLPHEDEAASSRTNFDPEAVCKLKPLGANGDGDNNVRVEVNLEEEARAAEAESDLDLLARLLEDSLRIDPRWEAGPRDLCVVFWSSGTTGAPKGIPKTNQQLLAGKRTDLKN